jgi:hypothetical protein
VIDDFEDGDLLLPAPALGGRVGKWYAFGDGSGIGSVDVFGITRGASSTKALHAVGTDFTNWGSGVGVDLSNSGSDQSTKVAYDASAASALTLWARAEKPTAMTVVLPDVDTDAAGNICISCGHHYMHTVQLSATWQRFTASFSDLELEAGGSPTPTAFKASGLFSLQLRFAAGTKYDVLVDDVAFIAK